MQNRSDAMFQTVQEMLRSTLTSQARRGDSVGIWTFNEELHSGLFALQQWTPESKTAISDRVVSFLRAQKLEKKSRLDKVIATLNRVVKNSPFLTVILVCTGDEEVHGTPFDQRINEFFLNWRQQQLEARTPFVIALRAQAGVLVDCSMNPAPWPAELPALPKELFVALPVARPVISEPRKPATSSVPPLIISGRKHETPPAMTNAVPGTPTLSAAFPGPTNPIPLAVPNIVAAPAPAMQATSAPVAQASASGTTAPASAPPTIAAAQVPPRLSPAIPTQIPQQTVHPPNPEPGAAIDSVKVSPSREPAKVAAMLAANAGSTAITSGTAPVSAVDQIQSKPPVTEPAQSPNSREGAPAIQVASINVAKGHSGAVILSLGALVLVGTTLAGIWIWRRRSRVPGSDVSLITESIDRRRP